MQAIGSAIEAGDASIVLEPPALWNGAHDCAQAYERSNTLPVPIAACPLHRLQELPYDVGVGTRIDERCDAGCVAIDASIDEGRAATRVFCVNLWRPSVNRIERVALWQMRVRLKLYAETGTGHR